MLCQDLRRISKVDLKCFTNYVKRDTILSEQTQRGFFMSYYQEVIYDTLCEMRIRAITTRIREDHELKDLYNYLREYDVATFYEELEKETLPQSVIDQYGLFCDIVQEIAR